MCDDIFEMPIFASPPTTDLLQPLVSVTSAAPSSLGIRDVYPASWWIETEQWEMRPSRAYLLPSLSQRQMLGRYFVSRLIYHITSPIAHLWGYHHVNTAYICLVIDWPFSMHHGQCLVKAGAPRRRNHTASCLLWQPQWFQLSYVICGFNTVKKSFYSQCSRRQDVSKSWVSKDWLLNAQRCDEKSLLAVKCDKYL